MTHRGKERNPKGFHKLLAISNEHFRNKIILWHRGLGTTPNWLKNQSPLLVLNNWKLRYSFWFKNSILSSLFFTWDFSMGNNPFPAHSHPRYQKITSSAPLYLSHMLRKQGCTLLPGNHQAPHSPPPAHSPPLALPAILAVLLPFSFPLSDSLAFWCFCFVFLFWKLKNLFWKLFNNVARH